MSGQPGATAANRDQPGKVEPAVPLRLFHTLALVGAGGLTLVLTPIVLGNLHPWGNRGALATVQWLVYCPPRWLCLALALGMGLRSGRFDWISAHAGRRWFAVAGAHLGIGLASFFCLVDMSETRPPVLPWLRALAALVSLVVPGVVIAFLAAARSRPEEGRAPSPVWRGLLAACVLIGVIVGATDLWRAHLDTLAAQREEAANKAERATQGRVALAQMDGLTPDAPLECWLPFTDMAGTPAVIARAQETIRARPHLTFDLVGCLRRGDAPMRALVLNFVRGGGLPLLSTESIPAAREALGAETAAMRARIESQPDVTAVAFDPECLEAVFLVARYPGHEAAFVGTLREMRAVLDRLPKAEPVPAGQAELDLWLRTYDLDKSR